MTASSTGLTNVGSTRDDLDPKIVFDRHLTASDRITALTRDVGAGLTSNPKELPPKWFYDANGSMLFDAITRLPEYYPTRAERAILAGHVHEIAVMSRADTLVELGSGTSAKTRLLLDALQRSGHLRGFVPFDVDESVLSHAAAAIRQEYPAVRVHAIVGDFERHLHLLPDANRRLVAFLGGTIGNLAPAGRHAFLTSMRAHLKGDDMLLLGCDLVKDPDRLVAAYNDSAGVTAAFNRNVLSVINHELDADFDPRGFAHVARWDAENSWIEMRLRSVRDQRVHVGALDLSVSFAENEQMRTEISAKFTRDSLAAEFAAAGLAMVHWWTDSAGDFGLALAVPA
ncbi:MULTISPECIES: L-histidine N(alpha)-methyltransferase [Protofrankia]|uniref:Histidine N-alpha-methyltransferase n=1 Tax=Candidatus Protofrankia datiscae TaxID=2716812 RepID=F8B053_9ACTN|nr:MULTISPECIES: L-histidine N(alpha)-methyltransferase [Protofrankia]AEH11752.1 methyltransferase [Candidatus Protofrankia datiscae]